ncbi:MAG TPA: hypothetical protein VE224_05120, partial [Pseudolabrys sp.]|nr:hypothetical protein [Pseudolabrys sp.]
MPDTIRAANERLRSRPRRGGFLAAFVIANYLIPALSPARADARVTSTLLTSVQSAAADIATHGIGTLSLALGIVTFLSLAVIALLRTRRHAAR